MSDCAASQTSGCTPIAWPGQRTTAWHEVVENAPDIRTWHGGLVDDMRDATGQMYRRNRYYDPATGQFTQTDPIGLAGGLNSYGFAAGDPVSYGDPYGLCPPCSPEEIVAGRVRAVWNELSARADRFRRGLLRQMAVEGAIYMTGQLGRIPRVASIITEGKIGYLFGRAAGRTHNVERAAGNLAEMSRLGIRDTERGHALVRDHLDDVVQDGSNIARSFTTEHGAFEIRESIIAGPSGAFAKVESTWQVLEDGTRRFTTAIIKGGQQ